MEENENEIVESQVEEIETTDVEEEANDDTPTLEDYQKLKKERETLLAQKEHWKKKATQSTPLEKTDLKTNNEYLTREEAVLLAKGYDEEDLSRLNILAKADGKKLTEVVNDEMFVAWKEKKDEKVKAVKAQLGSSKSSISRSPKSVSEMTPEEHRAYWQSLQ